MLAGLFRPKLGSSMVFIVYKKPNILYGIRILRHDQHILTDLDFGIYNFATLTLRYLSFSIAKCSLYYFCIFTT